MGPEVLAGPTGPTRATRPSVRLTGATGSAGPTFTAPPGPTGVAGLAGVTWPSAALPPDQKLIEHWRRLGDRYTKPDRQMLRPKRQRQPRASVPGGLLTAAQAAARLNCSIKTLSGHVAAGDLKYVVIGSGIKRLRRFFTVADLDQFIANQTRKDAPLCRSSKTRVRPIGALTSNIVAIGFSERPKSRPGGKRKR
jgi:hypothetical protein